MQLYHQFSWLSGMHGPCCIGGSRPPRGPRPRNNQLTGAKTFQHGHRHRHTSILEAAGRVSAFVLDMQVGNTQRRAQSGGLDQGGHAFTQRDHGRRRRGRQHFVIPPHRPGRPAMAFPCRVFAAFSRSYPAKKGAPAGLRLRSTSPEKCSPVFVQITSRKAENVIAIVFPNLLMGAFHQVYRSAVHTQGLTIQQKIARSPIP